MLKPPNGVYGVFEIFFEISYAKTMLKSLMVFLKVKENTWLFVCFRFDIEFR